MLELELKHVNENSIGLCMLPQTCQHKIKMINKFVGKI